ncbi:M81 family metallopeptidase [Falsigemmobacter faecalis]|uniref:M81 family peptidase n=1 Tax=Falsigemmobacter faecalis TaxID=2488730 RepID=A0A3P3DQ27_9RHOB|nr:M81 family metallopeptidase [Falsigemmobacter faecalis]RRH76363.1 M81 family peptidase [Falsigemmobacter faecalis]
MPRAAVLQLFHEANAFTPTKADYDGFLRAQYVCGEAVRAEFGATSNWLGGITTALDAAGYEVAYGLCTGCLPGGTLDHAAYLRLCDEILASFDAILAQGPVDLVALALHGALHVEGEPEPETRLAEAVRARIGDQVPLGVTLDFHANPEPRLCAVVDVAMGGRLYPHSDTKERGARMIDLLRDPAKPRTRRYRLPIMVPMSAQTSDTAPFADLVTLSEALSLRPGLSDVVLMGGFPYHDSEEVGTSVLVTGTDRAAMDQACRAMAAALRTRREAALARAPLWSEAREQVCAAAARGRVVLADAGDNPGSGGVADVADLFRDLAQSGLSFAAGFLVDPEAVKAARAIGAGHRGRLRMGRLRDGTPWEAEVLVERLSDLKYRNEGANLRGELLEGGESAILRIGEAGHIILTTERIQAYDTQAFRSQGIVLEEKAIIHVKSSNHFRTSYTPLAEAGVFVVDSGGFASTDARVFPFTARATRILPLKDLSEAEWQGMVEAEIALP